VPIVVGAEDPATLAGLSTDLVVTISARIGRTAVLAAPVTALYTDIDGTSHVLRAGPVPADDRPVPVTVGACASGWCQIERSASTLKAGDLVVVGRTGAHVDD
jgi:hypothetical protein